jgi:N-acetylneuraminic acid mutarotase
MMKSSFWLTVRWMTSLLVFTGFFLTATKGQSCDFTGWETYPPMPTARSYTAGAILDHKFYVFGGILSPTTATDVVEMYDLTAGANGSWVTKHKLPHAMEGMAAVTRGDRIYLIGGAPSFGSPAWTFVYEYNPELDTFIAKTPLPQPRVHMGACVWNDEEIYVTGGANLSGATDAYQSVLKYNPDSPLGWQTVNPMNKKRGTHPAVVLNDKIYVTGGDAGIWLGSKTMEVLDLATPNNTWQLLGTDMLVNRWMHGAGVIDDKLIVIGGASGGNELSSVEVLEISNGGEWLPGPDMLNVRRMFAYASDGDAIYVAGGQGGGVAYNSFEKLSLLTSAIERKAGRVGLLHQNYPNPFADGTTIQYEVTSPGNFEITLQDAAGKLVKTTVSGHHYPGKFTINIQANDLANGIYFYTMKNEDGTSVTRKMVVFK